MVYIAAFVTRYFLWYCINDKTKLGCYVFFFFPVKVVVAFPRGRVFIFFLSFELTHKLYSYEVYKRNLKVETM